MQRHHVQQGRQLAVVLGHADHVQTLTAFQPGVGVGQHVQHAAAGAHLVHIAFELFQQRVIRRHRHHRHGGRHQCQRAVLELAGRVGLGVDVADLLELERTLQGNRVVQAAAQKQRVVLGGEVVGPGHQLRLQRQHGLQRSRQVAHGLEVARLFGVAQVAARLGQRQRQQEQAGQLGGEGLGAGHADFDPGTGDVGQLTFTHHGAGGHVADGQGVRHTQALRVAQRGQGVGSFARLGDGDHQRARVGHRVAVAVLAGHFHLGRDLGDALQPIFGGAAAVIAGAAGEDQHRINALEHARRAGLAAVKQLRRNALHALQRVGDGTRLLKNLFLHVVPVGAQLGGATVRQHGFDRALRRREGFVRPVHQPIFA